MWASFTRAVGEAVSELKESIIEVSATIREDIDLSEKQRVRSNPAPATPSEASLWSVWDQSQEILVAELRQKIMLLCEDDRTFTVAPPQDAHLDFDLEKALPLALKALKDNAVLESVRYKLVPRHVKELDFWRNFFFRVTATRERILVADPRWARLLSGSSTPDSPAHTSNGGSRTEPEQEIPIPSPHRPSDSDDADSTSNGVHTVPTLDTADGSAKVEVSNTTAHSGGGDVSAESQDPMHDAEADFISDYVNVQNMSEIAEEHAQMKAQLGISSPSSPKKGSLGIDTQLEDMLADISDEDDDTPEISDADLDAMLAQHAELP